MANRRPSVVDFLFLLSNRRESQQSRRASFKSSNKDLLTVPDAEYGRLSANGEDKDQHKETDAFIPIPSEAEDDTETVTKEAIIQKIREKKEVIEKLRSQPWAMHRKVKTLRLAQKYLEKHEAKVSKTHLAKEEIARQWKKFRRWCVNMSIYLIPWEARIKRIESHFGSVVSSYFTFLRWIFWVNLMMSLFTVMFIVLPESMADASASPSRQRRLSSRKELQGDELREATHLQTIWDFEGILRVSPLFYGFYGDDDQIGQFKYQLPLAYFLIYLVVLGYSFFAILRKMAENARRSKMAAGKAEHYTFSWKMFTGWDYTIGNTETAANTVMANSNKIKETIMEYRAKMKEQFKWIRLVGRITANLIIMSMVAGSAVIVYHVVERSKYMPVNAGGFRKNEVPITVSIVTLFFPNIFEVVGRLEKYHPRTALRLQLGRILLLYMLNFYTLMFALFSKMQEISAQQDQQLIAIVAAALNTTAASVTPATLSRVGRSLGELVLFGDSLNPNATIVSIVQELFRNESLAAATTLVTANVTQTIVAGAATTLSTVATSIAASVVAAGPMTVNSSSIVTASLAASIPFFHFLGAKRFQRIPESLRIKWLWRKFGGRIQSVNQQQKQRQRQRREAEPDSTPSPTGLTWTTIVPNIGAVGVENANAYILGNLTKSVQAYLNNTEILLKAHFTGDPRIPIIVNLPDGTEKPDISTVFPTRTRTTTTTTTTEIPPSTTLGAFSALYPAIRTRPTRTRYRTTTTTTTTAVPQGSSPDVPTTKTKATRPRLPHRKHRGRNRTVVKVEPKLFHTTTLAPLTSAATTEKPKVVTNTGFPPEDIVSIVRPELLTASSMRHLCWETYMGQEVARLISMDLVMTLAAIAVIDFLRGLVVRFCNRWWCWNLETQFPEYGEFKVAENVLHIVNNQGMIWLGLFFAPLLPAMNNVKLIILMYVRSWACVVCNVPATQVFRASRSNNFYLVLLLLMLFLCTLPVGYVIASRKPSKICGPFTSYDQFYSIISVKIQKSVPPPVYDILQHIASPGIVIPIFVLLLLVVYFLVSLARALRESNEDLKKQLHTERTEEKRKVYAMAGHKNDRNYSYEKGPTMPDNKKVDFSHLPLVEQQRREAWNPKNLQDGCLTPVTPSPIPSITGSESETNSDASDSSDKEATEIHPLIIKNTGIVPGSPFHSAAGFMTSLPELPEENESIISDNDGSDKSVRSNEPADMSEDTRSFKRMCLDDEANLRELREVESDGSSVQLSSRTPIAAPATDSEDQQSLKVTAHDPLRVTPEDLQRMVAPIRAMRHALEDAIKIFSMPSDSEASQAPLIRVTDTSDMEGSMFTETTSDGGAVSGESKRSSRSRQQKPSAFAQYPSRNQPSGSPPPAYRPHGILKRPADTRTRAHRGRSPEWEDSQSPSRRKIKITVSDRSDSSPDSVERKPYIIRQAFLGSSSSLEGMDVQSSLLQNETEVEEEEDFPRAPFRFLSSSESEYSAASTAPLISSRPAPRQNQNHVVDDGSNGDGWRGNGNNGRNGNGRNENGRTGRLSGSGRNGNGRNGSSERVSIGTSTSRTSPAHDCESTV